MSATLAPTVRAVETLEPTALPQPQLSRDPATKAAVLVADYTFPGPVPGEPSACVLTIPAGFVWDLSSVPRALWTLIAPHDLGLVAPLVHDALYRCGGLPAAGVCAPHRTFTRAEADQLFRRLMEMDGVAGWRRRAAYRAVRWFGGGAWRGA